MQDSRPKLRFANFAQPWEQRKLGEHGITYSGLTGKTKEDFGHGDARFVPYTNVFDNPISDIKRLEAVEVDPKQNEVKRGDVLFTVSSETPEEVGMSSVWPADQQNVYLNSFCFGYRQDGSFDSNYLAYMLRSPSVRDDLILLAQGISRFNISKGKVMELDVPCPDSEEQIKIGSLFAELENLITLHQHKLKALKNAKKSLGERLFPEEGTAKPKLRVVDNNSKWQRETLGNLLQFSNGFNGSAETFGKGIKLISVMDVLDEGFITYETIRSQAEATEEQKERFKVEYGDVLFQRSSETFEDAGTSNVYLDETKPAIFGGFVIRGKRISEYDPKFMRYLLATRSVRDQITRRAQGAQHINISQSILEEIEVLMPSREEQEAIGETLYRTDRLIALCEEKIFCLKRMKQAFLNTMFV